MLSHKCDVVSQMSFFYVFLCIYMRTHTRTEVEIGYVYNISLLGCCIYMSGSVCVLVCVCV